jgi:DNA-binding Xre family transcriptional regulator
LLYPAAYRGIDMATEACLRPRLKHPEAPRLLARNVWRFREQRRLTPSALAEKLDWPLVEIDKIENGDKVDLSLDDLERIALALFVSPGDLLGPNTRQ